MAAGRPLRFCIALVLLVATCSVASAAIVFQEDFESGLHGWSVDNGLWQVGLPSVGPASAHSGQQCASVSLTAPYSGGVTTRFTSPAVTLPAPALGEDLQLHYWSCSDFFDGGLDWYDSCAVGVRPRLPGGDWGDWTNLTEHGPTGAIGPWVETVIDLTPWAGQTIQIGFLHSPEVSTDTGLGLYLDDVSITAETPALWGSQDFENGWQGWSSSNGVWQVGATVQDVDPHTGAACAGTYLLGGDGEHAPASYLLSPTLHLPALASGGALTVHVAEQWSYYYTARPACIGYISVCGADNTEWGPWIALPWAVPRSAFSPPYYSKGWILNQADLTPYAGQYVRLGFLQDSSFIHASGYDVDDIVIEPLVVAGFTAVPQVGAAPLTVQFTDTSAGAPTQWTWTFGDGTASTEQNPVHTYTAPGSYTVSLLAASGTVADTRLQPNAITVLPAIESDFVAEPTVGYAPLAVQFADLSTPEAKTWSWTFGDGTTATVENPRHTYAAPGSYTVTLTAADDYSTDTETKADHIRVVAPLASDFTADPVRGVAPLSVAFSDTSQGAPSFRFWSFGDGELSADPDPTHTYRTPGHKTVELTLSDLTGTYTVTKTNLITVSFPDVPVDPAHWALDQVLSCVDARIVSGYADGTYRPLQDVTRDQMAAYLSRALYGGEPPPIVGMQHPTFPDVPFDHWAWRYVEYAQSQHLVTGYTDGTYRPTEPVDRAQMAVYISRSIADPTGDAGLATYVPPLAPTFTDVPADFWAYKYIEYAKAQGVVQGYADGYRPGAVVTRDQMAVYVARAFAL